MSVQVGAASMMQGASPAPRSAGLEPEWRTTPGLVAYPRAVAAMESRVAAILASAAAAIPITGPASGSST